MNNIKEECEKLYAKIRSAEKRLSELRETCKHENTFEGIYEWAPAHTFPAVICSDCGRVVKSLFIDATLKTNKQKL